jgi:hypothetical protein
MIARTWTGTVRRSDADEYAEYIRESEDAIRSFAGDDIEAAVLYPEDERYLIGGESAVAHYEVVGEVIP